MLCPNCKKQIPDGTQFCPECGANTAANVAPVQKKKPITKKWWFWVIIAVVVIVFIGIIGGGGNSSDAPVDSNNVVVQDEETVKQTADETTVASASDSDGKYRVGDVAKCGDVEITFKSAEKWTGYSQYLPPADGNMIVRYEFDVVNNGSSDFTISYFSFNGYADNQSVEQYYEDDGLSATLSSGRTTSGYVYFEVPENTKSLEAELEVNLWTEEKAVFVVEF